MSTKIFSAYRLVNPQDLWPIVRDIRVRGTEEVVKVLRKLYLDLMPMVLATSPPYLKELGTYK